SAGVTMDGGPGTDTLDYTQQPGFEVVNVFTGVATNGFGSTDHFSNIERFLLGAGSDTIIAGPGGDHFYHGGGGDNTIDYSNATTPVTINLTTATVTSSWGTDTIQVFATFIGGQGNDRLVGGPGSVFLDGSGGLNIVDFSTSPNGATFDMAHGIFIN